MTACRYIVDLFVSVDGVAQQNGHVCFGETADLSRDKAIDGATQSTEPAVGKALKDGPPGSERPFASLVGRSFRGEHFVHLPLIATDVDEACVKQSQSYGPQLLAHFSALLGAVGGGTHAWEVRCSPRGIVQGIAAGPRTLASSLLPLELRSPSMGIELPTRASTGRRSLALAL